MADANFTRLFGGTTKPFLSFVMICGNSPTFVATTGTSHDKASSATKGKASETEGSTKIDAF